MRLPFSSRKGPEPADSSSRRSSIAENTPQDQATQTDPDDLSESSTVRSNSTPLHTPATSYSSYNSVYDRNNKTGVYELSVVDNSGTFLPPSPPDNSGSRAWGLHRKQNNKSRERVASLDGPFIISRESFEGYRRSFDIGGTSPIPGSSSPTFGTPRLSLDSNIITRDLSVSSGAESKLRVSSIPKVDEGIVSETPFEDVKLEDEDKPSRRTILRRFGFGQRTNMLKKRDGEELQIFKMED